MAESSANLYKKNLDKAFSQVGLNQGTMTDHAKYSQGMKEDKSEDSTPMIRRSINKLLHAKKKETQKQDEVSEEWSEKYKKSIDCSHPKGFSQRAHCQGRKKVKKEETKEEFTEDSFQEPYQPTIEEQEELNKILNNQEEIQPEENQNVPKINRLSYLRRDG